MVVRDSNSLYHNDNNGMGACMAYGKTIQILLVDDTASDVELTRTVFSESKLSNIIHVVSNGEEALDFLFRRGSHIDAVAPDVILLDIGLPKMDGMEVLRVIKSDPQLRKIPVVMLTGSEEEADIVRSYRLHANCYITKPMDFAKFLTVVKGVEGFWLSVVTLPSDNNIAA